MKTPFRTKKHTTRIAILALASLALAGCLDKANCDELRQDLYEKKRQWAKCDSNEDCIAVGGNPKDCTGVLSCPFAVNRASREVAERLMLSAADDSVDCHLCSTPTCAESTTLSCEPVTRRCVLAGETFGPGPGVPPGPDAGTPETDASAADVGVAE